MRWLVLGMLVAWTWTTPDGVQWFTDDRDRIPCRYLHEAERVEVGRLRDYPKLTLEQKEKADVAD
jgi:hypothetical protein